MSKLGDTFSKAGVKPLADAEEAPVSATAEAGSGGEEAAFKLIMKAISSGNVKSGTAALKDFIELCTSGDY